MLKNGVIELGSGTADCRVPDAVWHFQQFRAGLEVPNYGASSAWPSFWSYFPTYPNWSLNDAAPAGKGNLIPIKQFYGDCLPTQVLISTSRKPREFNSFLLDWDSGVPYPNRTEFSCYLQWGAASFSSEPNPEYYARQDNSYYVQNTSSYFYKTTSYYEWNRFAYPSHVPSYNYGPDDRCTFLITIDPSYPLNDNGPLSGAYYYPPLGSQPGWPAFFNGIPAQTNQITPYPDGWYGNYSPGPTDCSLIPSFIQTLPADIYVDAYNEDKLFGIAIFRDRPMMTREEFLCWHEEYDWFEDPGFK